MSEKAKGGHKEKKEGKELLASIEDFSLARNILEGGGEVLQEYELERRFLPNRLLTKQELAALETRLITQKYVTLKDADGTQVAFRLRITRNDTEGLLYRIARKSRMGELFGKEERQIRFMPLADDPRTKEHQQLWNLSTSRSIQRQRYYIPHTLPNGGTCEIHYEVWLGGKEDGFVRVEVEFSNDEDEKYYEAHVEDPGILPDWIGEDVTFEPKFLAKSITKDGLPKKAVAHMKALRKKEG
ncbi:hypothetical protein K2Y00_02040 [Patescibacteria group bacterium]|nr:hypothetical protein [Patescibacteria group bacterium]